MNLMEKHLKLERIRKKYFQQLQKENSEKFKAGKSIAQKDCNTKSIRLDNSNLKQEEI